MLAEWECMQWESKWNCQSSQHCRIGDSEIVLAFIGNVNEKEGKTNFTINRLSGSISAQFLCTSAKPVSSSDDIFCFQPNMSSYPSINETDNWVGRTKRICDAYIKVMFNEKRVYKIWSPSFSFPIRSMLLFCSICVNTMSIRRRRTLLNTNNVFLFAFPSAHFQNDWSFLSS